MRPIPLIALLLVLAVVPRQTTLAVAATAAATLLEVTPFVLAAWFVARRLPGGSRWLAFLGCGCGAGPAALSLPATAATWLALGPWVAMARIGAAMVLAGAPFDKLRVTQALRAIATCHAEPVEARAPIATLHSLVPFAIVTGVVSHVLPILYSVSAVNPIVAAAGGAMLGIVLAPCGLGIVGIASALHGVTPAASIGFLCTAGIVDIRALLNHRAAHVQPGGGAYAIAAIACALVAWHGGASLVHPRFVLPLFACALAFAALAWQHRSASSAPALVAPLLLLVVAIAGAPPPTYTATATTLGDAFPGERLSFVGVLARSASQTSLVRYAITCCRADAAPIAVVLVNPPRARNNSWLRADGTLFTKNGMLELHVDRSSAVAPPSDPFLYR